jgi:hypothetical protein
MSLGLKGSADILGCLPDGRFLAVEVKAERGGCPRNSGSSLGILKRWAAWR